MSSHPRDHEEICSVCQRIQYAANSTLHTAEELKNASTFDEALHALEEASSALRLLMETLDLHQQHLRERRGKDGSHVLSSTGSRRNLFGTNLY